MASRRRVWLQARLLAARRRWALATRGGFDPYPAPPPGAVLSPSETHGHEVGAAPLRLSWARAGIADPAAWQAEARSRLAALTGFRESRPTPHVIAAGEPVMADGLVRRHLYLRVGEQADVPVDLVWSAGATGPLPAMICLQGTNAGAHLSWGEARMPADPIKIAGGLDFARQAARRGYLAVCVEQMCFGERRETLLRPRSPDPCIDASMHALVLGRTLLGERVGDVASVVDWLVASADGADPPPEPARIRVMGNSAGGTTALHAGALDTRIGAVLACSCIGRIGETVAVRAHPSGQNVVPGILDWMELEDVVALIAPRPFLTVAGDRDHIWPAAMAETVVDAARGVYAAIGAPDAIAAVPVPGPHRFYPDVAWPAFDRLVAGKAQAA